MAHHAFIAQLIVLLPEHPAILSILPCLLASSCTCSLLLQLFSLLHHSTSLSLHTSLLHILTAALQLPVSPPSSSSPRGPLSPSAPPTPRRYCPAALRLAASPWSSRSSATPTTPPC